MAVAEVIQLLVVMTIVWVGFGFAFVFLLSMLRDFRDTTFAKDLAGRTARGIKIGTINQLADVELLARSIGADLSESDRRAMMTRALVRANAWLLRPDRHSNISDSPIPDEDVRLLNERLKALIVENDRQAPFAALPAEERALLTDITVLIETGKVHAARDKIEALASVIQAKDKAVRQFARIKRWSVPAGIIGVLVSLTTAAVKLWNA